MHGRKVKGSDLGDLHALEWSTPTSDKEREVDELEYDLLHEAAAVLVLAWLSVKAINQKVQL